MYRTSQLSGITVIAFSYSSLQSATSILIFEILLNYFEVFHTNIHCCIILDDYRTFSASSYTEQDNVVSENE